MCVKNEVYKLLTKFFFFYMGSYTIIDQLKMYYDSSHDPNCKAAASTPFLCSLLYFTSIGTNVISFSYGTPAE